jgi:S-(hydroxymethyl)glutathione dehydrogenase/alcohol dehydrogenase
MRAAVLHHSPGELVVEDLVIDAPADDEVLVRIAACGLCHSDLHFMDGLLAVPVPSVLGHEAAGVVEAVGSGVTAVEPGDHVVGCLTQFCGYCRECILGRTWLCERRRALTRPERPRPRLRLGETPVGQVGGLGAFAEQMLVHHSGLVKVPAEVPFDRAALLGCAVVTGVGSVVNGARVEAGSSVAVIGCGGIGLNIVQGALLAGAGRIVAIDRQPAKLDLAKDFGATDLVDASVGDPVDTVLELLGGVDYAFEAIGLPATAAQALAMVRPGRTAYLVGVPPADSTIELPGATTVLQGKGVQGLFMGSSRIRHDIPLLADLYLQGRLKLDELISHRITLDEVNEGYERLRHGVDARSVVVF